MQTRRKANEEAALSALFRPPRRFRNMRSFYFQLLFIVGLLLPIPAPGADPFYFGSWKVASATVAPWWPYVEPNARRDTPDPAETKLLIGKLIVIGAKGIAGPRQAACNHPKYAVKDYPADFLFQGMFGEMHEHDKSVDPQKVAESVGFRGSQWKTLETGCGNELDFHFLDENSFAFGLNNYIYLLKRQ
jgi:hypothetical protein